MASPTEPDKIVSDLDERSHVEQKKSDRRRRAARTQTSEVATQTIGGMADDSVESIEESKRKRGNATDHEQESSPINEQKKVESKGASTNKKMKIKKRTVGHVDYTDIGNEVFLQMLSTAFSSLKYFKHISHGEDPLKFLPQYLNLVNQECYSELHLDQCEFFHRIGTTENIWNGRVSKHMAEKYSIRETYGASEDEVTGRLQQMKNQLEQTRNQVKQFEDDFLARCPADEDHLPQMMNELSSIVHLFVKDKQKHIRNDLHHHRQLLILYATDHLLLQMFFDLEPTDTQKSMAARIWKLTEKQNCVKRQAMIMEHSMQPIQPGVMMHHLDTKAVELSSEGEGTSSDQQAKEEREKIVALKQDILGLVKVTTNEIMNDLERTIVCEQNKALLQQREMPATAEWQKKVYQAIINRRHHMIEIGGFAINHALMNHRESNE